MTRRTKAIVVLALACGVSPSLAQPGEFALARHYLPSPSLSGRENVTLADYRSILIRARPAYRTYDGIWGVVIQTIRGNCPTGTRILVRILRNRLIPYDQSYQVNGRVAPGGAVRVVVSAGGQRAAGSGRLSRYDGRGIWRASSGECSGRWFARRQSY